MGVRLCRAATGLTPPRTELRGSVVPDHLAAPEPMKL